MFAGKINLPYRAFWVILPSNIWCAYVLSVSYKKNKAGFQKNELLTGKFNSLFFVIIDIFQFIFTIFFMLSICPVNFFTYFTFFAPLVV